MHRKFFGGKAEAEPELRNAGHHTYCLKLMADGFCEETVIEFTAIDAYQALVRAKQHTVERPAELWRDGRKICTIRLLANEVWEVMPPDA